MPLTPRLALAGWLALLTAGPAAAKSTPTVSGLAPTDVPAPTAPAAPDLRAARPPSPLDESPDSQDFLHGFARKGREWADASPNPAFKAFADEMQGIDREVVGMANDKISKDKIEEYIADGIGRINKAVDEVNNALRPASGAPPPPPPPGAVEEINNGASYLNNRAGNYGKAKDYADRVLSGDEDNRDALTNRANAYNGLKQFERGYADADRVLKTNPGSAPAATARAMAAYGLGNYLQALEDSRKALALDPNQKTAFSLMKLAEARIQPAQGLPASKDLQSAAISREYEGMLRQVNQVSEKSREVPPTAAHDPAARLVKSAAAKIALKDYWGALSDADKAVGLSPGNPAAYYHRAAAHNLVGKYAEAAQDATQALSLDPNDAAALDARSSAYYHMGRVKEALADAERSLSIKPQNAYAYLNRAYAQEKLGDATAMLADLKTAASLNPQFEPVYRDAAAASSAQPLSELVPVRPLPPPPRQDGGRPRSFLVVLVSSVIGGLLIATGLLHIFSTHWTKKITAELKRVQEAITSPGRRPSAIDHSYTIGASIGMGGMGVVYEALDKALKRKVAIKVLRPELKSDARERERFLQEARTVAALHHPSIVEIYSIVEDQEGLYLVFEFIAGKSVDALLGERKRLKLNEAKAILKPVCQALEFAHQHNVVHRDLKPSNIMITEQGQVKVMDFGIARQAKDSLTKFSVTNSVIGTPHYMAPEQEEGIVRKESDVFSLGTCLYEMLTGERPYKGPSATPAKLARRYEKPSRLAATPAELDALIDAALEPDPDKRLRSPKEFWARLERIA